MSRPLRQAVPYVLLVGLALTGAYVSGMLLVEHDGGWQTSQESAPVLGLCESEDRPTASCASVIGSRWGALDFHVGSRRIVVPTSLIGVIYFVSLAIWLTMLAPIQVSDAWAWRVTLGAVTAGVMASVALSFNMIVVLPKWCPLCSAAHGISGLLALGTLWVWRKGRREASVGGTVCDATAGLRPVVGFRQLVTAGAVCATVGVALWGYSDTTTEVRRQWRKLHRIRQVIAGMQDDAAMMLREYDAQPLISKESVPGAGRLAASFDAAPTLVIFSDYDHSPCACFEVRRRTLIEPAFDGRLEIEYRIVSAKPDDATSNGNEGGMSPPAYATPPAAAAEAARIQGGHEAWATMHALLFRHRYDAGGRDYGQIAASAGLNVERFMRDLVSDDVRRSVERASKDAADLGIETTPAAVLNGRRVPDLCMTSSAFWTAMAERFQNTSTLLGSASPR